MFLLSANGISSSNSGCISYRNTLSHGGAAITGKAQSNNYAHCLPKRRPQSFVVGSKHLGMRVVSSQTWLFVAVENPLLGEAGLINKQNSCGKVGLVHE